MGRTFARLAAALPPGEAVPFVVEGLARAAADEARHGALCDEIAVAYGDVPPARPADDEPLPLDTALGRSALLVAACCVSETIASAYLEHCLAGATDPTARRALHELLRDEIGHAQLGWAHLAAVGRDPVARGPMRAALRDLVERARTTWHARIVELHVGTEPAHGYPSAAASCAVVDEAVEALVRRGVAHVLGG